ncbi:MAG: hypothetical protein HQ506_10600 [Candidatus Marinimicrobia bacterium]|nr:hypothetical protein [Candidatus Neomarinimicrobiota bacterium]
MRQRYGETMYSRPSRFLEEIPSHLLDYSTRSISDFTREDYRRKPGVKVTRTKPTKPAPKQTTGMRRAMGTLNQHEPGVYVAGMQVGHKIFGKGKIVIVDGTGPEAKVTVMFQGNVKKKLIAKFANLDVTD